jgi:uncharacterized Rmd1/YagE family protein
MPLRLGLASYTLPLLPGYNPAVNVRSSLAVTSPGGGSIIHAMEHAEERGYEGSYFPLEEAEGENGQASSQQQQEQQQQSGAESERPKLDMESNSIPDLPVESDSSAAPVPLPSPTTALEDEAASTAAAASESLSTSPEAASSSTPLLLSPDLSPFPSDPPPPPAHPLPTLSAASKAPKLAEALFFDYGVSVFFGFTEQQERQVLEDCEQADGCWVGAVGEPGDSAEERGWEMEECHFEYDPTVAYPRIFNGSAATFFPSKPKPRTAR